MLAGDARLDPDRVYVMGPSMGGLGSYMLAARRPPSIEAASLTIAARLPRHPESFAAVVPMCGGGKPLFASQLVRTPCWFFHSKVRSLRATPMLRPIVSVGCCDTRRCPRYLG